MSPAVAPGLNTNASILINDGNLSDTGSTGYNSAAEGTGSATGGTGTPRQSQKFPHLRAQLAAIARDYPKKPILTASASDSSNASLSPVDSLSARDSSGTDSELEGEDKRGWDELRVSSLLLRQVASLLGEEKEDELKTLLKAKYEMDDKAVETNVLELMHAHKDDTSGVPFLFLTPTRRPLSRPSSRASNHSFRLGPIQRPDTPNSTTSAPSSPSLLGPIRRPHTPAGQSPLVSGLAHNQSYINAGSSNSPNSSPTLAYAPAIVTGAFLASSLPASPLSSPRLLNAKAHEFRPIPRPLSAAASNPSYPGRRAETPSPDLWAHGSGALRGASKLAIASPLIPDMTLLPPGTPPRALTPTSPLRMTSTSMDDEDEDPSQNQGRANRLVDEDEDPFNPFHVQSSLDKNARVFEPSGNAHYEGDVGAGKEQWTTSYPSLQYTYNENVYGEFDPSGADPNGYYDMQQGAMYGPHPQDYYQYATDENGEFDYNQENGGALDGMTPFDVLSSVFGSTLAPSELEEALAQNGYDFDRSMQWLIEKVGSPPRVPHQQRTPPNAQQQSPQQYSTYSGGGVHVVSRGQMRGGRGGYMGGGYGRGGFRGNGRPGQGGNRVCRYFLAGECLRADCRFSHDLDRALCRFWLRGTCAKGDSCEFLHHLPNEAEIQGVTAAMQHTNVNEPSPREEAHDEFPTLSQENLRGPRRGGYGAYQERNSRMHYDPGRTRFSQAVKKAPPSFNGANAGSSNGGGLAAQMAGRKEAKAAVGDSVYSRPTVVAPRASPRIKLRSPTLLPTLPTGEALSKMYMSYRSRAIQLGAARNACLSRAADAWRRGDGASAKRFSREGHELNGKMAAEASEAAAKLVRERAKLAESAVKTRDFNWSDDPSDRTSRGKACGGGYGVCLGVASKDTGSTEDGVKLTQEERTESVLDVHGLHSNEATEVLEEFLLSLEKESFFGLAFIVVGEEKHTGTQDPARGSSRARLATGIREWLHNWGYPWNERDGIICVDPLTHMQ